MATLVVVRHGARETFHHLQATWALRLGRELTVMWDRRLSDRRRDSIPVERRVGERRKATDEPRDDQNEMRQRDRRQRPELRLPERRQTERRRPPPDMWGTLGSPWCAARGAPP